MSSNWQESFTEGGIPCGNISGLAAEMRPLIARPAFMLPAAVNRISDTKSKQYTVLRLAVPSLKVGIIITANPLTLVSLARLADSHCEALIRDIYDGTLSDEVHMPQDVRDRLSWKLGRPHRSRARELEQIVERTGHLWPRDFWPKLSTLAVWTGGSVAVYLPQVREYYGDKHFRDHGLSASEGRMTTPFSDGTSAGVLDVITHYFEFISRGRTRNSQPDGARRTRT